MDDHATRNKCVFCKIADGSQQSELVHTDDEFVAFCDLRPAAAHHLLVIPRQHVASASVLTPQHKPMVEQMVALARQLVHERGVKEEEELRLGFHWPPFTSIQHLHLHAIAPVSQLGFISRIIFRPNSYWFVSPETVLRKLEKDSAS